MTSKDKAQLDVMRYKPLNRAPNNLTHHNDESLTVHMMSYTA